MLETQGRNRKLPYLRANFPSMEQFVVFWATSTTHSFNTILLFASIIYRIYTLMNKKNEKRRPVLWVDSTSRSDSSIKMLNFLRKYFQVYPVTSVGEGEKLVAEGNKEFSVMCSCKLSEQVAKKLMPREQIKTIIIFCNYLPKGEENVLQFGNKFEKAFNFLNDAVDHLIKEEEKSEESNTLEILSDEMHRKLLFHIGRLYKDAGMEGDAEKYLQKAKENEHNSKVLEDINSLLKS